MKSIHFTALAGIACSVFTIISCAYFMMQLKEKVMVIHHDLRMEMTEFEMLADLAWEVSGGIYRTRSLQDVRDVKATLLGTDSAIETQSEHVVRKRQAAKSDYDAASVNNGFGSAATKPSGVCSKKKMEPESTARLQNRCGLPARTQGTTG